jgi:hypothetical protein
MSDEPFVSPRVLFLLEGALRSSDVSSASLQRDDRAQLKTLLGADPRPASINGCRMNMGASGSRVEVVLTMVSEVELRELRVLEVFLVLGTVIMGLALDLGLGEFHEVPQSLEVKAQSVL